VIRIFQEKISKAKDLYKQKEYEKALNLFYELKEEDRQLFEITCNFHYMWCVYRQHINQKDGYIFTGEY